MERHGKKEEKEEVKDKLEGEKSSKEETKVPKKEMLREEIKGEEKKGEDQKYDWDLTFQIFSLKESLLLGLEQNGIKAPTMIQKMALTQALKGRDIRLRSSAGSGKTTIVAITTLQMIDYDFNALQALILCPTRELAKNTHSFISGLAEYSNVRAYALVGGARVPDDIAAIKNGQQIIVGTPGRIYDFMRKGVICQTDFLKIISFEETDEIMGRGFKEQIEEILGYVPPQCRLNIFGSTFPSEVLELSSKFQMDPVTIDELMYRYSITHYYSKVLKEEDRLGVLLELQSRFEGLLIVFCRSEKDIELLADLMKGRPYAKLHDHLGSEKQVQALSDVSSGVVRFLLCTDTYSALSKIDKSKAIVVHYHLPLNVESFLQRMSVINSSTAKNLVSIITKEEENLFQKIEKHLRITSVPLLFEQGKDYSLFH